MSWLHDIISKFHTDENGLSKEGKQIVSYIEDEVKKIETGIKNDIADIKAHLGLTSAPVPTPTPVPAIAATPVATPPEGGTL